MEDECIHKQFNVFVRNLVETGVEEDTVEKVFPSYLKDYKSSISFKNHILKHKTTAIEETKKLLNVFKKFPTASLEKYLFKLRKNERLTSEYLALLIKNCKSIEECEHICKFLMSKILESDHVVLHIPALLELVIIEVDMISEKLPFSYTHEQFAKNILMNLFLIRTNIFPKLDKEKDLKKVSNVISAIFSILIEFKLKFHSKMKSLKFLKDLELICGFDKSLMLDCIAQVTFDGFDKTICLKEMKDLFERVLIKADWKEQPADMFVKICLAAKKAILLYGDSPFSNSIKLHLKDWKPSKDFYKVLRSKKGTKKYVEKMQESECLSHFLIIQSNIDFIYDLCSFFIEVEEVEKKPKNKSLKDDSLFMIDVKPSEVTVPDDDVSSDFEDILLEDDEDSDKDLSKDFSVADFVSKNKDVQLVEEFEDENVIQDDVEEMEVDKSIDFDDEDYKDVDSVDEDQKDTDSDDEDQKDTDSVDEDQKDVDSVDKDQKDVDLDGEDQKDTGSVDKDQKDTDSDDKDQKDTDSVDKDQKDVDSVDEDQKDTDSVDKDQKDVNLSPESQIDVDLDDKDQKDVDLSPESQIGVDLVDEDQKDTGSVDKDQKDTDSVDKDQKDVNLSPESQMDVDLVDEDQKDVDLVDKDQKDTGSVDKDQKDVNLSPESQIDVDLDDEDQKDTGSVDEDQKDVDSDDKDQKDVDLDDEDHKDVDSVDEDQKDVDSDDKDQKDVDLDDEDHKDVDSVDEDQKDVDSDDKDQKDVDLDDEDHKDVDSDDKDQKDVDLDDEDHKDVDSDDKDQKDVDLDDKDQKDTASVDANPSKKDTKIFTKLSDISVSNIITTPRSRRAVKKDIDVLWGCVDFEVPKFKKKLKTPKRSRKTKDQPESSTNTKITSKIFYKDEEKEESNYQAGGSDTLKDESDEQLATLNLPPRRFSSRNIRRPKNVD